jgi:hypothetical protein
LAIAALHHIAEVSAQNEGDDPREGGGDIPNGADLPRHQVLLTEGGCQSVLSTHDEQEARAEHELRCQ